MGQKTAGEEGQHRSSWEEGETDEGSIVARETVAEQTCWGLQAGSGPGTPRDPPSPASGLLSPPSGPTGEGGQVSHLQRRAVAEPPLGPAPNGLYVMWPEI